MKIFESSKHHYQIVTAPDNCFRVQFKSKALTNWMQFSFTFQTPTEALDWIKKAIKEDDFQPKVVEIFELEQEGGGDERQDA